MPRSLIFATAATWGLAAQKLYSGSLTIEGVDDRAFRLAKNRSQQHVDQYSFVGGCSGLALGAVFGRYAFSSILASGMTGVGLAVLAHTVETIVIPELEKRGHLASAAASPVSAAAEVLTEAVTNTEGAASS